MPSHFDFEHTLLLLQWIPGSSLAQSDSKASTTSLSVASPNIPVADDARANFLFAKAERELTAQHDRDVLIAVEQRHGHPLQIPHNVVLPPYETNLPSAANNAAHVSALNAQAQAALGTPLPLIQMSAQPAPGNLAGFGVTSPSNASIASDASRTRYGLSNYGRHIKYVR